MDNVVDIVDTVDIVDIVNTVDTVDIGDTVDTVDIGDTVDTVDTLDTVRTIDNSHESQAWTKEVWLNNMFSQTWPFGYDATLTLLRFLRRSFLEWLWDINS